MESSDASTCGFSAASMADKGRLPSSSKSSPSSAAGVSPPSVAASPSAFGSAGLGGGGGGGGTGFLNSATGGAAPLISGRFSGWPSGPTGGGTLAGWPSGPAPYMASRSMMSRSSTLPSLSSSRHTVSASKVSGLSHKAPIVSSRPASIRLAMAISPSRLSSSPLPISRRYMRTGSSVRSYCSPALAVVASALLPSAATGRLSPSPSSASSLSMTLMPISLSIAIVSSICSEDVLSDGRTLFSSS